MSDIIDEWVSQFKKSEATKASYKSVLNNFEETIDEDLDDLLNSLSEEEAVEYFKEFFEDLVDAGKSSNTINSYLSPVRQFINEESETRIPDKVWNRMRRREIPKATPETRDKSGSYEEWQEILRNMNINGRSLFSFLLSSGCRIGEALSLTKEDVEFKKDPPEAYIRRSKNERGRIVYFSDEAKEEIDRWLDVRDNLTKKSSDQIPKNAREHLTDDEKKELKEDLEGKKDDYQQSEKIWPFSQNNARQILYRAIEKAGVENGKDKQTGRKKLHPHSTRKFFESNSQLSQEVRKTLLGHQTELDNAYSRLIETGKATEEYSEKMHNLMFFQTAKDMPKVRDELDERKEEQEALKKHIKDLRNELDRISGNYAEFKKKYENEVDSLRKEKRDIQQIKKALLMSESLEDLKDKIREE